MRLRHFPQTLVLVLSLPVLACHDGSSGGPAMAIAESEPNDAFADADELAVGRTGHGTVAGGADTDFWRVALEEGEVVAIEVFGTRFDYDAWTAAGNAPRLRVFDTDGTTLLLEQSDVILAWNPGQDTDAPVFRAPAAGTYFLAVGASDALAAAGEYLLAVGPAGFAAPQQLELEPEGVTGANDSDATAEAIVPGTLHGYYVDDESDWYVFTVAEPSLVTFTLYSHRNGVWRGDDGYLDSRLDLLDSGLNLVASNDDAYFWDSSVHQVLTTPGTYYLHVVECCDFGDSVYSVEFTLDALADLGPVDEVEPNDDELSAHPVLSGDLVQGTAGPADDDVFSFAGAAGDRVLVQVFDASNHEAAADAVTVTIEDPLAGPLPTDFGSAFQIHRTVLTSTGTFLVRVTAAGTTDYAFRITREPAGFESEPNDALAEADAVDADGLAAGVISVLDDADVFAFDAVRGVPVRLDCYASQVPLNGFRELDGFGSSMAPRLEVVDANDVVSSTSSSATATAVGTQDARASLSLAFLPPATGTYFVRVTDASSGSGPDAYYVLQVR